MKYVSDSVKWRSIKNLKNEGEVGMAGPERKAEMNIDSHYIKLT